MNNPLNRCANGNPTNWLAREATDGAATVRTSAHRTATTATGLAATTATATLISNRFEVLSRHIYSTANINVAAR
jgi:hypothetical protein